MRPKIILLLLLLFTAADLFPQSGPEYSQTAVKHLMKGEYIQAQEYLNIAIRKEPASPELWFLRGYAKFSLDDYIGAEQDYSQSIALSPYLADVFTNRAIARTRLENYKGAMEDFDRAMEMDTANGEIWFYRARTNLLQKKHYSCIVDCNKAIRLKFRNEEVYILRASAETEIKRYDEAIADLDEAAKINPKNGNIWSQRGLIWIEREQPDSAIADFSRAIGLDSLNTYALFSRALAYIKKKDQVAALKDLNRVVRISPYNSYAYYNRAIVLIGLGEKRGAIHDFEIVSKLDPMNIVSHYYRGTLKSEIGDNPGALEDLNKTIELLPDYTDAWFARYEVKLKMKDTRGAQADYRQALELSRRNHLNPDSLKAERKDYLKSLIKLSGDFDEMNTLNSKLQNQSVDVQLRPMYSLLVWKVDFGRVRLHDVYRKEHYYTTVLTLAGEAGLVPDSILLAEVQVQTMFLDSADSTSSSADSTSTMKSAYFRRAVAFYHLRQYDRALADLNLSLALDSTDIGCLFMRACCRFELIRQLREKEAASQEIVLSIGAQKTQAPESQKTLEHTYDAVLHDLDRVLALDSTFTFAWYDRGYVNSTMGNYRASIEDFSLAVTLRPDLAEAFYNRGLLRILLRENHTGCPDLSRAGELGIADAYRVMKRHCYK